ncbi:DUF3597 domain-containing protein [Parasutterella sp.]|uniref:DUF3597 domain-containing protein n=1 Tax=Parasutterella sp. TaxID=2049037 RepID=UPI003AEF2BB8
MGLFNTILQKLGFMKDKAVEAVAGETAAAAEAPAAPAEAAPVEAAAVETVAAAAPAAADAPPETVDVVAVCEALAAKNPQKLNWRNSIVDLMKLLGMDSSLANRKELAKELGCPENLIGGDYSQMNVWLIKAVMKKLAENGGKVPEELK